MLTLTPAPPSEDAGGADAGPRPRYTAQKRRGVTAGPVLQLGIMADPRRPGLLCLGAEGVRLYSLPHLLLRAEAASSRGAAAFAWEPGAQLLAVAQKKKCVARLLVDGLSWWGRVVVVLGGGGFFGNVPCPGPRVRSPTRLLPPPSPSRVMFFHYERSELVGVRDVSLPGQPQCLAFANGAALCVGLPK